MRKLFFVFTILLSFSSLADEKKYTEQEFIKAVAEQVKKQVDQIKIKEIWLY